MFHVAFVVQTAQLTLQDKTVNHPKETPRLTALKSR